MSCPLSPPSSSHPRAQNHSTTSRSCVPSASAKMSAMGAGGCGPGPAPSGAGSGPSNPRKFSEKIALHTQRQAEETAAFQEVMMDITSTRVSLSLSLRSLSTTEAGRQAAAERRADSSAWRRRKDDGPCPGFCPQLQNTTPLPLGFRLLTLNVDADTESVRSVLSGGRSPVIATMFLIVVHFRVDMSGEQSSYLAFKAYGFTLRRATVSRRPK